MKAIYFLPFSICFLILFSCKEENPPLSVNGGQANIPQVIESVTGTYNVERLQYMWEMNSGYSDSIFSQNVLLPLTALHEDNIKIWSTELSLDSSNDDVSFYSEIDPSSLSIQASAIYYRPDSIFFEQKFGGLGSQTIIQYRGKK